MNLSFPVIPPACPPLVSKTTEKSLLVSKTVSVSFPSRFPFPHVGRETGNGQWKSPDAHVAVDCKTGFSSVIARSICPLDIRK